MRSEDHGNTHFGEPLYRRRGWAAASGVCPVSSDFPLSCCDYNVGACSKSELLVDHRDEFCWLGLPSTRLFGRHGAKFPHDCHQTKPRRAPATGSPIYSIGDPSDSVSADRSALASRLAATYKQLDPPTKSSSEKTIAVATALVARKSPSEEIEPQLGLFRLILAVGAIRESGPGTVCTDDCDNCDLSVCGRAIVAIKAFRIASRGCC